MKWPINTTMAIEGLDKRLKMLLDEGYDVCAASAILSHRSVGRGVIVLAYDMEFDRIVSYYLSRKNLYDAEVKEIFSYPAWQNILKITRDYPMKTQFCLVMIDQVMDLFYVMLLPYRTNVTPAMKSRDLQTIIDKKRK
jgi:hypothetical protein